MESNHITAISKYQIIVFQIVVIFIAFENAENLTKILRSHCIVHDPKTLQNVSCWARPFNRTVSVLNLRGNLTRVLNKVFVNLQLHKRSEIKFKPFLINVTDNFCTFMENQRASKFLRMLTSIYLPYTNVNHTCPYFGYVCIKDLPLDTNYNLPALWPTGEYRLDILVIGDERKIATIQYYMEIKEKRLV